jgi:hypothetical protein
MTVEAEVSALTAATTSLLNAVAAQQIIVDDAVVTFTASIDTINNDLNNVDNTADADKPVSSAGQTALDAKQPTLVSGTNISTVNGVSVLEGGDLVIARSPTSLAKIEYEERGSLTSDPVLPNLPNVVDDSIIVKGIGLLMWHATLDEPDDDETCFSTPSGQWLLHLPEYDLLSAWSLVESSILDELDEDEEIRFNNYLTTQGVI